MKNKQLFEVFMNKRNDADLFVEVESLIEKQIKDAIGNENAYFYDVLRKLSNSINNAGWENRRSERMLLINAESMKICDKYEEYLP